MKSPGFRIRSIPLVSKACKILKLNKNVATADRGFKGMSLPTDVYQDICKPVREQDQGFSWRNTLSKWQRNAHTESAGDVKSPRTSVRMYSHPWGKNNNGNSIVKADNEENKDENEEEGILTIEMVKPYNGYLGLVLVGGADTPLQRHYVNDILPNSSASSSDRVRIGDELLEVNGHTLTNRTHADALTIFRSLPTAIKLVIERKRDGNGSLLASMRTTVDASEPQSKGDPNISSPKARSRKRGIMQSTNDSSFASNVSDVIDVIRSPNLLVKSAKLVRRVSRCSSFVGGRMDEEEYDVMSMRSGDEESTYGLHTSVSDYDDRLSFICNTSEWCAQQLEATLQDHRSASPDDTISLKSLADSLPGSSNVPGEEYESVPCRPPFSRAGSLRMRSAPLIEDQEESAVSSNQGPPEPAMFLRKGSLRVKGGLSLRRISGIENQEVPATWPATIMRQRSSINSYTFVPPSEGSLRRSSSACSRPSSVYANFVPPNRPPVKSAQPAKSVPIRNKVQSQRTNSRRYIEKRTLATEVLRDTSTGEWGFTIAGGVCSPYGDLPIHVMEVKNPELAGRGLLKKGDEIVDFHGDNFEDITYLEADRVMRCFDGDRAKIVIKRKHIQRTKSQTMNTFGNVWSAQTRGTKTPLARSESFYY